jgi:hypothetical protein
MGKILIVIGLIILLLGLIIWGAEKLIGRVGAPLPGDIVIRRGNFTFYFPIVTSIVLSILLTLIFIAIAWIQRR